MAETALILACSEKKAVYSYARLRWLDELFKDYNCTVT